MTQITWNISREDARTIDEIVHRAVRLKCISATPADKRDLTMDVTAVHRNDHVLRLSELLDAPEFDFIHDIVGICRHIDRNTGTLKNCFVPRFAAGDVLA